MSQTVDTNVLVYASNAAAPEQVRAKELLDHLASGPELVYLMWPTVLSYLRLVTHPAIFAAPLSHAEATANVASLLVRPHVRAVGEVDGFWQTYLQVTAEVSTRGNLVPDAHLVALMIQHGVTTIWSRDRDLRKFDGITVLDPFLDRFAAGFTKPRARRR